MTKKPSATSMKAALEQIAGFDFEVEKLEMENMSHADALDMVVTLARDTLNPAQQPSAHDLKVDEVTDFVLKDFSLAFANNDTIGETLNKAGIFSPSGKPWTRSNVSKIMASVKERIVQNMNGGSAETVEQPTVEAVEAAATEEVEIVDVTTGAPIPSNPVTPEEDVLAELNELDELAIG